MRASRSARASSLGVDLKRSARSSADIWSATRAANERSSFLEELDAALVIHRVEGRCRRLHDGQRRDELHGLLVREAEDQVREIDGVELLGERDGVLGAGLERLREIGSEQRGQAHRGHGYGVLGSPPGASKKKVSARLAEPASRRVCVSAVGVPHPDAQNGGARPGRCRRRRWLPARGGAARAARCRAPRP